MVVVVVVAVEVSSVDRSNRGFLGCPIPEPFGLPLPLFGVLLVSTPSFLTAPSVGAVGVVDDDVVVALGVAFEPRGRPLPLPVPLPRDDSEELEPRPLLLLIPLPLDPL